MPDVERNRPQLEGGPSRSQGRRVAWLGIALGLLAFAPHAVQAWQKSVSRWDRSLSEWIHAAENEDTVIDRVDVLSLALDPVTQALWFVVVVVVAIGAAARGRRRFAAVVVLTIAGVALLGPVAKEVFARPPVDPAGTGYSFPSGHSLRTMAIAGVVALVAWPTRWRWWIVTAGAVVVLVTGVAVVYHEWHWVSDVLAGWSLALVLLGCVWLLVDRLPGSSSGRLAASGPR